MRYHGEVLKEVIPTKFMRENEQFKFDVNSQLE